MNQYTNLITAALLGLFQGLIEFFPVSSSGHILLCQTLSNGFLAKEDRLFDAFVQIGSGVAILLYFIHKKQAIGFFDPTESVKKSLISLITASIPVICVGLIFHDIITEQLYNLSSLSLMWIIGGVFLLLVKEREKIEPLSNKNILKYSVLIGLFQVFALIPGVSRSGATIIGGLISGLSLKEAILFSFFISIPPLIGAGIYSIFKLLLINSTASIDWLSLSTGALTAYITSSLFIQKAFFLLLQLGLSPFAKYRIALGFGTLAFIYLF